MLTEKTAIHATSMHITLLHTRTDIEHPLNGGCKSACMCADVWVYVLVCCVNSDNKRAIYTTTQPITLLHTWNDIDHHTKFWVYV